MAKQAMLFDFYNKAFKDFQLENANKHSSYIDHSSHPPPPPSLGVGVGVGMSHFSECLYRRDLGQIGILGGNWHFRWG